MINSKLHLVVCEKSTLGKLGVIGFGDKCFQGRADSRSPGAIARRPIKLAKESITLSSLFMQVLKITCGGRIGGCLAKECVVVYSMRYILRVLYSQSHHVNSSTKHDVDESTVSVY